MTKKVNRNDPCTCGSGKKYKKCCGQPGMGRHTASILDPAKMSGNLLGRISQAGAAFAADRKVDMLSKGVTVGRESLGAPKAPVETEKKIDEEKKSEPVQEND